jgi:hypothetical protein
MELDSDFNSDQRFRKLHRVISYLNYDLLNITNMNISDVKVTGHY